MIVLMCLVMAASCMVSQAQNISSMTKANSTVTVDRLVSNQTINLGQGTRLKILSGGGFKNCKLVGNNSVVEVNGNAVAFDNCTFSGSFVNSALKATHFGCKPDMISKPFVWRAKDGKKVNTKIRQGTNNKKALGSLAQFCSGSKNVTIELNGAFFTPVVDNTKQKSEGTSNYLTVKNATALTIHGGTIIQGIYFYNCSKIHVHDVNFVGLHEVHDFPRLFTKTSSFTDVKSSYYEKLRSKGYTQENTSNIVADQYCSLGIGGSSMRFIAQDGIVSEDILVENCRFEMRSEGIGTGLKNKRGNINNAVIRNCDFSHIYFQPVGFSGISNVLVDNVKIDYCLQPFSMGRWANRVKVQNSKCYNCFTGPKQELDIRSVEDTEYSYGNTVDNCYIQINDKVEYIDLDGFIFLAGQAKKGDFYTIRNTVFDIQKTSPMGGFLCRSYGLKLENVNINITYHSQQEKYDMSRLFNTGGGLVFDANYVPHIMLDNVKINANTRFAYLANNTGVQFDLSLNNVTLSGNAICVYPVFSGLNRLNINSSTMDITCQSTLIERTPRVSINNLTCTSVGSMVFNSSGIKDDIHVTIANSTIKSKGAMLNMSQTAKSIVKVTGCTVQCGSMVSFTAEPQSLSMSLSNNAVNNTGSAVFAGLDKAKNVFKPQNVSVTGNIFTASKATNLYDKAATNNVRKVFATSNKVSGAVRVP